MEKFAKIIPVLYLDTKEMLLFHREYQLSWIFTAFEVYLFYKDLGKCTLLLVIRNSELENKTILLTKISEMEHLLLDEGIFLGPRLAVNLISSKK